MGMAVMRRLVYLIDAALVRLYGVYPESHGLT
jgi:hypothetical protein